MKNIFESVGGVSSAVAVHKKTLQVPGKALVAFLMQSCCYCCKSQPQLIPFSVAGTPLSSHCGAGAPFRK